MSSVPKKPRNLGFYVSDAELEREGRKRQSEETLSFEESLDVSIKLFEKMHILHGERVIHRDLNLEKIQYNKSTGELTILGSKASVNVPVSISDREDYIHLAKGGLVGSAWRAPEVRNLRFDPGEKEGVRVYSEASDVYAGGTVVMNLFGYNFGNIYEYERFVPTVDLNRQNLILSDENQEKMFARRIALKKIESVINKMVSENVKRDIATDKKARDELLKIQRELNVDLKFIADNAPGEYTFIALKKMGEDIEKSGIELLSKKDTINKDIEDTDPKQRQIPKNLAQHHEDLMGYKRDLERLPEGERKNELKTKLEGMQGEFLEAFPVLEKYESRRQALSALRVLRNVGITKKQEIEMGIQDFISDPSFELTGGTEEERSRVQGAIGTLAALSKDNKIDLNDLLLHETIQNQFNVEFYKNKKDFYLEYEPSFAERDYIIMDELSDEWDRLGYLYDKIDKMFRGEVNVSMDEINEIRKQVQKLHDKYPHQYTDTHPVRSHCKVMLDQTRIAELKVKTDEIYRRIGTAPEKIQEVRAEIQKLYKQYSYQVFGTHPVRKICNAMLNQTKMLELQDKIDVMFKSGLDSDKIRMARHEIQKVFNDAPFQVVGIHPIRKFCKEKLAEIRRMAEGIAPQEGPVLFKGPKAGATSGTDPLSAKASPVATSPESGTSTDPGSVQLAVLKGSSTSSKRDDSKKYH